MNPSYSSSSWYEKPRNFEKEEKLKKAQIYKKANQKHPAFKK